MFSVTAGKWISSVCVTHDLQNQVHNLLQSHMDYNREWWGHPIKMEKKKENGVIRRFAQAA